MTQLPKYLQMDEAVKRLVRKLYNDEIVEIKAIENGIANSVFLVTMKKKGSAIVRLSDDLERIKTYEKERWCTEKARAAGVQVPMILSVGNDLIPYAYSVATVVPGVPGNEYTGDQAHLWRQVGHLIRKVHSIKLKGFGRDFLSDDVNRSWKDFIHQEIKRLTAPYFSAQAFMPMPISLLNKVVGLLQRGLPLLDVEPRLAHGDVALKNVLVNEAGEITGLIDWDEARGHAALAYELGKVHLWLTRDEQKSFLVGYGQDLHYLDSKECLLITILCALGHIPNFVQRNEWGAVFYITHRLRNIMLRYGALYEPIFKEEIEKYWHQQVRDPDGKWLHLKSLQTTGYYLGAQAVPQGDDDNRLIRDSVRLRDYFVAEWGHGRWERDTENFTQWLSHLYTARWHHGRGSNTDLFRTEPLVWDEGYDTLFQVIAKPAVEYFGMKLREDVAQDYLVLPGIPKKYLPYDEILEGRRVHHYPIPESYPTYFEAIHNEIVALAQMKPTELKETAIKRIAKIYQYAINCHPFVRDNHPYFMNIANALLELHGLHGIPLGFHDVIALNLPMESFSLYFFNEVKQVNPALNATEVPPLLLQPLVEIPNLASP